MTPTRVISMLLLFTGLNCLTSYAQAPDTKLPNYPQNYFRNPLDIPIFLAGNFGECRPNHFHSGIDIKTKGEENQPVYAAADGYICRIKMESGGFGHGLYIAHPNGYTTLYAHLNDFAPLVQQYVHEMQYEKQRWNLDLQLSPGQFPVKKGDLIAYSGNTGGSTAPHLHFEIRNTKTEHPLNPMLFGLPITDNVPPVPNTIAFYRGNIYETTPEIVALRKSGVYYRPAKLFKGKTLLQDTIALEEGVTGVGIQVDDYMDGSDNQLTFYTASLYLDDSLQSTITLDDIGYDESRYINAYVDYKTRKQNGRWLQCFFQQPGNRLNRIFSFTNSNKSFLTVGGKTVRKVSVRLRDCMGNTSEVVAYVRPVPDTRPVNTGAPTGTPFFANRSNTFSDPSISFTLDERQLYSDFTFVFNKLRKEGDLSERYQLHYAYVPLHHYFDLRIKPIKPVPFQMRGKVALIYEDKPGGEEEGSAAEVGENGYFVTKVRSLGKYWLTYDTVAPTIRSLQKNGAHLSAAKRISFVIKDATTSVRSANATIDGNWVCLEQHGSSFFYTFDDHCGPGKHEMIVVAADENGNRAAYTYNFDR